MILSWRDAQAADGGDGYNVVLHARSRCNGAANGFPPLHAGMDRNAWTQAFEFAYARMYSVWIAASTR